MPKTTFTDGIIMPKLALKYFFIAGLFVITLFSILSAPAFALHLDGGRAFSSQDATPTPPPFTFEDDVIERINQERLDNGNLPPYKRVAELDVSSQTHSYNMADRDFFMHCDPDTGERHKDRMTAAGYDWDAAGENIAAGYWSPEFVMSAWMNSTPHRNAILSTTFREVGAGYYYQWNDASNVRKASNGGCTPDSYNNGAYYDYWTTDFGKRNDVFPVVINREAFKTTTIYVDLYIYQPPNAVQMRFSNDNAAWSAWETFTVTKTWPLAPGTGMKTVYAEVATEDDDYVVSDNIWLDDQTPPPTPPRVSCSVTEADLWLSWEHDSVYLYYDVWKSDFPYFMPSGEPFDTVAAAPWQSVDANAVGDPAGNHYYLVQGVTGNSATNSNRTGEFDFSLTPGE